MEQLTFKPTVFWAWNSKMTNHEIERDIKSFFEQGIGGVFVHARAGLEIEYLGKEWFDAFTFAIDQCKKYGIEVWIYDEQGWPSGFAGGLVAQHGEDYVIKYLVKTDSYDEVDKKRHLGSYRKVNSKWQLCNTSDAEVFIYYKIQPPYVDLLNPDVTDKFIEITHEVYKKHFSSEFGHTIKGVFTDEPQIHVSSLAWSVALPKTFKEMNGYDYLEQLPLLFEEENDDAKYYRYQYYDVVRHMFVNNYTRKLDQWAKDNHLILTGHFAGEEGLCIQVASNTGVMPHYEFMDMAGIDSLGKRLNPPLLMKQIESVANQWGRKRILSETFACTGNGVSFKELKTMWGYHLSFGVNYPCMSISMTNLSGIRKRDYPVFISKQQPWWDSFHYFSEWVEKGNQFTVRGDDHTKVLLISSVNSALYENIFSHQQKIVSSNYRKIVEMLINLQISFDIGDETLLKKHGRCEDDVLTIQNASYHTVILPEQTGISRSTLDILKEFKNKGGRIIQIQRFPTHIDGYQTDEAAHILKEICDEVLQEREGIIEKYWLKNRIDRIVHIVDQDGKTQKDLIIRTKFEENKILFSIFNKSKHRIEAYIRVSELGYLFEQDILTGDLNNKTLYQNEQSSIGALEIDGGEFKIYEFTNDPIENSKKLNELSTEKLHVEFKELIHDQILTLDYASYAYDQKQTEKKISTVHILEKLYQIADHKKENFNAHLSYEFDLGEIMPINLSLETEGCQSIRVNDSLLWNKTMAVPKETIIDECIKTWDISTYVKKGKNIVTLDYVIEPMNLGYGINEVHDSVRNKFSYPISIEPIYLSGKFDVKSLGHIEQTEKTVCTEGPFVITKQTQKSSGDVTIQNNYFYRGNILYEGYLAYEDGIIYIKPSYYGIGLVIKVNGKEVGLCDHKKHFNLTPYLRKGLNQIEMIVLGSLRNTMGPHHHISGEPEYTGVHTFTGEYGNGAVEDLSSDGITEDIWTDRYHFIRQGLISVEIIKSDYKEKNI